MTEEEWLACSEPWPMLKLLRATSSHRKRRLLLCAFCRQSWSLFERESGAHAIEVSERLADGLVPGKELRTIRRSALLGLVEGMGWREEDADFMLDRFEGFHFEDDLPSVRRSAVQLVAFRAVAETVSVQHVEQVLRSICDAHAGASDAEDCALIRCVFGNPFQSVMFAPLWRTDTAVALARQMYESREFSAMPILADALQDAGCDRADMLDHCRGPGLHIRGCGVVDLVLGKE